MFPPSSSSAQHHHPSHLPSSSSTTTNHWSILNHNSNNNNNNNINTNKENKNHHHHHHYEISSISSMSSSTNIATTTTPLFGGTSLSSCNLREGEPQLPPPQPPPPPQQQQQNIAFISQPSPPPPSSTLPTIVESETLTQRRRTLSENTSSQPSLIHSAFPLSSQFSLHKSGSSSSGGASTTSSGSWSSSSATTNLHQRQQQQQHSPRNHSQVQLYNFVQNQQQINTKPFKSPLLESSNNHNHTSTLASGEPIQQQQQQHHFLLSESSFQEEDQRALTTLPSTHHHSQVSATTSSNHPLSAVVAHSSSSSPSSSPSLTMSSGSGSLMIQPSSSSSAAATSTTTTTPQVTTPMITGRKISNNNITHPQQFSPKSANARNSSLTFPSSTNTTSTTTTTHTTPTNISSMNNNINNHPYLSNTNPSVKPNQLTNSMAPSGPTSQQLQPQTLLSKSTTVPSSNNPSEAASVPPPPTLSTSSATSTRRSNNNNNVIPALSSEPPTVKLPSIYALLTSNKDDPYLNPNKNQNSEIIYLRPIAKMVESSKRKQTCYAHFGNNIVKKQSSLRSKIRGIVGSRRAELFEQQKQQHTERGRDSSKSALLPISSIGSGEAKDGTSSASHSRDTAPEERLSENNISMDVMKNQGANAPSGSSDMDMSAMESDDPNQYMLNSAFSGDDFGLTYEDMINFEDNELMNMIGEDTTTPSLHHSSSVMDAFFASTNSQSMGPLGFNSSSLNNLNSATAFGNGNNNGNSLTVSTSNTSLLENPARKGFSSNNSLKYETSSGSLSSFLNTPTTPLQPSSFPTSIPSQKEFSSLQNLTLSSSQSTQQNTWETSNMNSSLANNPFLNISLDTIPVSSNSGNFFVPSTQKVASTANAGTSSTTTTTAANGQTTTPPHYSSTSTNQSIIMNSGTSEPLSSSFNNMKRAQKLHEFVADTKSNQIASTTSSYADFATNSNNMNINTHNNMNASSRGISVNTHHQQQKLMETNQYNHQNNFNNNNNNLGLNLGQSMQSPTNSHSMQSPNNDTHSGILYAQKSGIDLASLFALTLQQQQKQANAYNESVSNSAGTFNFDPTSTQQQPFKTQSNRDSSMGSKPNNMSNNGIRNSSNFNSSLFASSQQGNIGTNSILGSSGNAFQSNKNQSFTNKTGSNSSSNHNMTIDPSVLQRFIETNAADSSPTSMNLQSLTFPRNNRNSSGLSSRTKEQQQQLLMGSSVTSSGFNHDMNSDMNNGMSFGSNNAMSHFMDQQPQTSRLTSPTHAMIGGTINPLFSKLHQQHHQQQHQQNMNNNHQQMQMKNVKGVSSNAASRKQQQQKQQPNFSMPNFEENTHQVQSFNMTSSPPKRKTKTKKDPNKQQQLHELSETTLPTNMQTNVMTSNAAPEKGKTKRIKIKQDFGTDVTLSQIVSPQSTMFSSQQQQQHSGGHEPFHHHATPSMLHSQDEAAMEMSPNFSDDEEGNHGEESGSDHHEDTPHSPTKKKRKSHITASQIGIIELENNEGFECSFCNRKFKRKSDIKVHIRRHTGERPYLCEIEGCGKAFTTASNLRRHNRNVHSKE
ncbi:hypothetical protein FDP41_006392 [Naegleria fowleri]|uniref:C2H2-type domain-containing protein n=1 Tax=Naegleria fowleri TaxID=5763 RepID=A0A6A5BJZ9_NAEFO|nr:uncharacterized protein FDP41_006392 [Naegleria fowleri]KAF0974360.1 hypothetical protein FDP41_006392 [Naegleria fowleri]